MANKKLPIGIQTFSKIRKGGEDDYYYVDKTPFIARLVDEGAVHHFLSRPRRFGKSMLVDTLKNLFGGKEELFRGLYIHDKWDWTKEYPVVRLDFSGWVGKTPDDLNEDVMTQLGVVEKKEGVSTTAKTAGPRFFELVRALHEKKKQRVVILVDEYDKPITDTLETERVARAIRKYLRGLYGNLKRCEEDIQFSFLTGVSKFSRTSLFPGLNNLRDITLKPEFSSICGYTENDLDAVFAQQLEAFDREKIRNWYNGYNWCGDENVYNPYSILLLLDNHDFQSWWFRTGTPSFLIKTLGRHKKSFVELDGVVVGEDIMSSFDVGNIDPAALLFQSGYLTIAEKTSTPRGPSYKLECPNREVRMSLHGALLKNLAPVSNKDHDKRLFDIGDCIESADFDGLAATLQSLLSTIPYHWYIPGGIGKYEGHFAITVCAAIYGSGLEVRPEEPAGGGRVDMAVVVAGHVVLFEFKVLRRRNKRGDAMRQLRKKNYAERYRVFGKPIYLVGMEFSPAMSRVGSSRLYMDVELA